VKHLLESSLPSRDLMPSTQDRGVYDCPDCWQNHTGDTNDQSPLSPMLPIGRVEGA
jgi:hypothetical protein